MSNPESPDDIIQRIVGRYLADPHVRTAMARMSLLIDENVNYLLPALQGANFKCVTPKAGMSDEDIQEQMLPGRVLITNNTKDFIDGIPVHDYGVIGLEALRFIDPSPTYKDNQTVRMISKAISDHKIVSNRSGFVLMLHPDGHHVYTRIE